MAKVNPVKLKQDADRLEKAGKLDQAIALYRQIVDDSPRDWNTINKIGDLYAKLNKFQEANEEYAKVADFYAKDGFHLKAIAIWKKINKLDPSTLGPYLNLAELYAKQGLMMEAKGQYQIVVEEYIKRGKMRDAGEVLRRMADIDPADLKVRSKLADLYTREGNSTRAIEEHVAIAEELSRKGHLAEALQVLEKGLKIDARSVRLRLEVARVHLVQKNFERAAQALEEAAHQAPTDPQVLTRLGEAYLGARKIAEAERIFQRLLELDPEDVEARTQMGRVHIQQRQFDQALDQFLPLVERHTARREGDRAAALLQEIVQHEPAHVKTLVKLAEVYRLLQKDSLVVAAYSQLTEAYRQQGLLAQAAAVLETLVAMEPDNGQHREKLQHVRRNLAGAAPSSSATSDDADTIEEDFDLHLASDDEFPGLGATPPAVPVMSSAPPRPPAQPVAAAGSAPSRPRIEPSGPLGEQEREFVDEHLAEGKVFRKYGLVDKAAEQFEAIVARFPDHAEARQELRDLYEEKNQSAKAAEQCLALAEIARLKGDAAAAAQFEAQAEALLPAPTPPPAPASAPSPAPPVPAARVAPSAPPAAAPVRPPQPVLDEEEEIPLVVEEDVHEALANTDEIALPEEFPGLEADLPSPAPAAATDADSEELEVAFGDAFAPPAAAPARAAEQPPAFGDDETFALGDALADAGGPDGLDFGLDRSGPGAEDELSLDDLADDGEALAAPPAPGTDALFETEDAAPAPAAEPALPPDLARILDEVADYLSLGFVDDARDALREASARYGDHPSVRERMAALGLSTPAHAPAEATPAPAAPPVVADALEGLGDDLALDVEVDEGPITQPPMPAPRDAFDAGELVAHDAADDLGLSFDEPPAAPPTTAAPEPSDELALDGLDDLGAAPVAEADVDAAAGLLEDADLAEPASSWPPAEPGEASDVDGLGLDFGAPVPEAAPADDWALPDLAEPAASAAPGDDLDALDVDVPSPAPAPPAAGDALGDLGAELFGAFAAVEEAPASLGSDLGDAGLADIFREFKKGVDRQLGQEDYDTRYNLGIAYKEMGLIDEAIAEFQLAAKDPGRVLECSSMLGICFLDKGMPKLAVKWFDKGLAVPGRSEEEYQGLRYDLACAYEADGDRTRARDIFMELYGQDAQFRDVADKLRALTGGR
jgi:tetratricopeptide (TPR) repeat protein